MLAFAPLIFWAWLTAEDAPEAKSRIHDVKKNQVPVLKKVKKKPTLTKDEAISILLENGFLPELTQSPINFKNIPINEQKTLGGEYERVRIIGQKKPILLHFWATWCGPCKRELPSFAEFVRSQDSIAIFMISPELKDGDRDSAAKIWDFYHQQGLDGLNVCADIGNVISLMLDINGIPVTAVLSSEGLLLGRFIGATEWNNPELQEALEMFLTDNA